MDLTLGDVLRIAAAPERHGRKPALIWGEGSFTYPELNASANQAAHALLAMGLRKGDRVAVLARNCPEYVWLYFALAKLGAILVPVNFWYRSGEIEYTLRQSGTTTFLFDERFRPQADEATRAYGGVRHTITWGGPSTDLAERMASAAASEPDVLVPPSD
ncbi:MAG: AMP-binding protein, partial [Chloroflexota bacterium]